MPVALRTRRLERVVRQGKNCGPIPTSYARLFPFLLGNLDTLSPIGIVTGRGCNAEDSSGFEGSVAESECSSGAFVDSVMVHSSLTTNLGYSKSSDHNRAAMVHG